MQESAMSNTVRHMVYILTYDNTWSNYLCVLLISIHLVAVRSHKSRICNEISPTVHHKNKYKSAYSARS